ncbi:MAG: 16S rRNA methyltransferase [Euryarchaeota archaeon]|nr:16S rRNA methyltransferase [Euryarchaeota archaeon]
MMHLILADSELELVPQPIQGHPAVVKHAKLRKKRPSNLLLDATYHHQAIRKRYGSEAERRGRPDIAHFFLMNAQESVLNKQGRLRVYVHTRNNEVIYINPETRLPKSYPRFVGLMENLFHNGVVPNAESPLLWLEKMSLPALVDKIGAHSIVMSEKGAIKKLGNLDMPGDVVVIIGGFPSGDYITDMSFADEIVSIFDGTLMAWVTAYEVIAEYERSYR